jgi:hypothetical protein
MAPLSAQTFTVWALFPFLRRLSGFARHFMALLEYDRLLDATPRLARCIVSLFDPVLCPGGGDHLEITQEELGL